MDTIFLLIAALITLVALDFGEAGARAARPTRRASTLRRDIGRFANFRARPFPGAAPLRPRQVLVTWSLLTLRVASTGAGSLLREDGVA